MGNGNEFEIWKINNNMEEDTLLKAILLNKFKLLSIEKNEVASALWLSSKDGLQQGLNKVRLLVDGVEQTIFVNFSEESINLNDKFKDVTSVQILSVESVDLSNIDLSQFSIINSSTCPDSVFFPFVKNSETRNICSFNVYVSLFL